VNKNHYSKNFVSDNFLNHDPNYNSINPADVSVVLLLLSQVQVFDIIVIEYEASDQKRYDV